MAVIEHLMWVVYDLACIQDLKEGTKPYRKATAICRLYQKTKAAIGRNLGVSGRVYVDRNRQCIEVWGDEGDYTFDFKGNLIEFSDV